MQRSGLTFRCLKRPRIVMARFEYIKLFMEYETDDMPVVYFYEVDLDGGRFCRRAIEIFHDGRVERIDDLYRDVIEAVPIPTAEELNAGVWGEGFRAFAVSEAEFDEIQRSGVYHGNLSAP